VRHRRRRQRLHRGHEGRLPLRGGGGHVPRCRGLRVHQHGGETVQQREGARALGHPDLRPDPVHLEQVLRPEGRGADHQMGCRERDQARAQVREI
jgi:hypothetical protein